MKIWLAVSLTLLTTLVYAQDEEAVNTVFTSYKNAIVSKNGHQAFELINQKTISFYTTVWKASNQADSLTVTSFPFEKKLWVLTTRHLVTPNKATQFNSQLLFEYLVKNGWIHKENIASLAIGEISIENNFAIAQMLSEGYEIPYFFLFEKENGTWKINLIAMLETAGRNVEAIIRESEFSENQFIIQSIEQLSGKKANKSIWQPFKR